MKKLQIITAAFCTLALSVANVSAAVFPDVPDGHIFQKSIEQLHASSIISGNPNGLFLPNNAVNRAEMLKMLYKAAGKVPDPSSVRCFPDVGPGSWYESFVCDAAMNQYVNGYPDGTFQPAKEVNKVEALKMIANVIGIEVDEVTTQQKDAVKFVDVSTAAWYTKYLYAAYAKGILPIPGQSGSHFFPEAPLLRGEAAAYIYNALNVELDESRSGVSSSSGNLQSSSAQRSSNYSSSASRQTSTEVPVDFPFNTSGKFNGKQPYSYLFSLDEPTTTLVSASVNTGGLSCRLYLLPENGYAMEYYLGHDEGKNCFLQVALSEGNYQLQLQPTVADSSFTVDSQLVTGDGNDGFKEAKRILNGVPKSAVLEVNDIQDFYIFSVSSEKSMQLDITNALELECLIFPMADVDLFGFEGPQCNQSYLYPTGTYYVSVGRSIASKASKKTYTITLR